MKLIKFEKPGCEPCMQLDQYLKDKSVERDPKRVEDLIRKMGEASENFALPK